jgi:hypothetical protein
MDCEESFVSASGDGMNGAGSLDDGWMTAVGGWSDAVLMVRNP